MSNFGAACPAVRSREAPNTPWRRARPAATSGSGRSALAHAGIPQRVLGSLGLYERTEVRDAFAYLTLLHQAPSSLAA
jgi:hypothetical protein